MRRSVASAMLAAAFAAATAGSARAVPPIKVETDLVRRARACAEQLALDVLEHRSSLPDVVISMGPPVAVDPYLGDPAGWAAYTRGDGQAFLECMFPVPSPL